jgi:hypothetical protein
MAMTPKFMGREETRRFRDAINIWSARMDISRNALFTIAREYGRNATWVKDRYYGRVLPKEGDLFWAEKFSISRNLFANLAKAEALDLYIKAVDRMCYSCAGTPVKDPEATCWDSGCPLRPISPIKIVKTRESQKTQD